MARRKHEEPTPAPRTARATNPAEPGASLLGIVSARKPGRSSLASRLSAEASLVVEFDGTEDAVAHVRATRFDAVVIDAEGAAPRTVLELLGALRGCDPSLSCVISRESCEGPFVLECVRAGACDVVPPGELPGRLAAAFERTGLLRAGEAAQRRRARRLRETCRSLVRSRHELMTQMGRLCADMAGSYRDLTDQMTRVSMSSELSALLRQELDLENLLRTTLEYTLRKIGPTNAAVFLPGSTGDYTLGAYVNYDCTKEAAETLLDHLADVAAPAFEAREDTVVLTGAAEVAATLGPQAEWMGDSTLAALSCRQDSECLAVLVFFRDRRTPFADPALATLRVIADLFGRQLARVIRTHHRHIPRDQWRGPGDGGIGPDDIDLAA